MQHCTGFLVMAIHQAGEKKKKGKKNHKVTGCGCCFLKFFYTQDFGHITSTHFNGLT